MSISIPVSAMMSVARNFVRGISTFYHRPTTIALISLAREMLEEAFAPHDPRTIHWQKAPEQVAAVLATLKPTFIHHPECKKLIPRIMSEHGGELDKLYFDVPRLRSAYPSHFLPSGIAHAFHPHRDTWYSGPMCQINWWMPVYPLNTHNTMGFYPRYCKEIVENNSQIYNYYEWNTKNRASAAQHVKQDAREQAKPQQELDPLTLRYIPPPGGVVVFSGGATARKPSQTRPISPATASIPVPSAWTTSSQVAALASR